MKGIVLNATKALRKQRFFECFFMSCANAINQKCQLPHLLIISIFQSDPDRTQTCDLQNRNLSFYSLNYGA